MAWMEMDCNLKELVNVFQVLTPPIGNMLKFHCLFVLSHLDVSCYKHDSIRMQMLCKFLMQFEKQRQKLCNSIASLSLYFGNAMVLTKISLQQGLSHHCCLL